MKLSIKSQPSNYYTASPPNIRHKAGTAKSTLITCLIFTIELNLNLLNLMEIFKSKSQLLLIAPNHTFHFISMRISIVYMGNVLSVFYIRQYKTVILANIKTYGHYLEECVLINILRMDAVGF